MTPEALRAPESTWEYCLSAADELVAWHLAQDAPASVTTDLHPHVVLLLAAAIHARATEARLQGPAVADVALDGPGGVVDLVIRDARTVLRAAPARPGEAQREQLLDSPAALLPTVQVAAAFVLLHHAATAGAVGATIRERATAMSAARRRQQVRAVADIMGDDDW